MSEDVKDNVLIVEESLPQHDISNTNKCEGTTDILEGDSKSVTKPAVGTEIIVPINKVDEKHFRDAKRDEMSPGKKKLYTRLNKQMKIEMTDGRVLIGIFLCTDRDANVILGSCTEYLNPEVCGFTDEPRILGLVMVPGRHIVSIHHDVSESQLLIMPEEKDMESDGIVEEDLAEIV